MPIWVVRDLYDQILEKEISVSDCSSSSTMRAVCCLTPCVMLIFSMFSLTNSYYISGELEYENDAYMTRNYDRIDEVRKKCASFISSASELKLSDNRVHSIKNDLSFANGDWEQEGGNAPLLPFDDKIVYNGSIDAQSPMKLVSFGVTDIDGSHPSKRMVNVNGVLHMVITEDGPLPSKYYSHGAPFVMWRGHTQLSITFQGIYIESRKNGGERVICLLGSTMLPSREPDSADQWEWVKRVKASDSSYNQPPLSQDDQIMLVLRYPKTFSLTKRAILGEMRSLNSRSNPKYFDRVHLVSQLDASTDYQFSAEKILSKACTSFPYPDKTVASDVDVYKGLDFCHILKQINHFGASSIVPNWRCNGTDEFCSKLGPFVSDKATRATDGGFKNVKLLMQYVRCQPMDIGGKTYRAKVSAVFRAVSPSENQNVASHRSGLGNKTLSAEGLWNSSNGQLCMVGCLGMVDTEGVGCDSRICLYLPVTFSIKQRSIMFGSIASIMTNKPSYPPLTFEMLVLGTERWDLSIRIHPYYRYTKIDNAGVVLEKDEPFSFGAVVKKSMLKFPKLEESQSSMTSLSLLSEDLTFHVPAIPDPIPHTQTPKTDVRMEIISLGPLFMHYWLSDRDYLAKKDSRHHTKAEYTEKQLLLNVSAQLTLSGESYNNISTLSLEGLYDPHVGKMYMIGCRDVRASWNVLFESMDLEAGLDCLIEVVASYPPTTAQWLFSPSAKISISSKRTEDDPLYFQPVKLQTLPILYRQQREDILSRRGIEGILRILTLSFLIGCILSQLIYFRDNLDSTPYVSLVMLGIQVIGYSVSLVAGAEALFGRKSSESEETPSYDLKKSQWISVTDYTVKLLVLVCFMLTLKLFQQVWRSRIRLLTHNPLEPHRVPGDKRVFLVTLTVHLFGYISVLLVHSLKTSQTPLHVERYLDSMGNSHTLRVWVSVLKEYTGLVQDIFLLPQVLGNVFWQIDCKPLRNLYYMGITIVRLLPHVYDYIRAPVSNPYFSEEYEFVNPNMDFYSKFGDVAIPLMSVAFAMIVYMQQRWDYEVISNTLYFGRHRLLPVGSKVYEKLPSQAVESELVSEMNRDAEEKKEHNDED